MIKDNKIYDDYFPSTNKCPVDGKECVRNNICKFWINNSDSNSCWYVDFNNMIMNIFNCDDSTYIYFRDKDDNIIEAIRVLNFYLNFNDKLNIQTVSLDIRIGFNSHRLAHKIKEKFKLEQWQVESSNQDGGDDADLFLSIPGAYSNCNEVKEKLFFIRDKLIPEIIEAEKVINTCVVCKEKSDMLDEYDEKAICYCCERKIIIENIAKYC